MAGFPGIRKWFTYNGFLSYLQTWQVASKFDFLIAVMCTHFQRLPSSYNRYI